MLLVDWKNTGPAPSSAVYASIAAYDRTGAYLEAMSSPSYCIFAAEKESQKIKPGASYREPDSEGFVLVPMPPDYEQAAKVQVAIVRVQ